MNQNFESKTWQKNDIKNRQTSINKKNQHRKLQMSNENGR
jgi:hypothetical protein